MFTGIVEEIGQIESMVELGDSMRLGVKAPLVTQDAKLGDSIAVNGVCLTVAELNGETFEVDVMQESLDRTALAQLEPGSMVNLERALLPTTRMGGHIVQGHVDGAVRIISRSPSEHWDVVRFELPAQLAGYVVEKGSIALNGTSLTVSAVGGDWFEVSFIPTTLQETTHGRTQVGELINVEVDVVAKYVEKLAGLNVSPVREEK